MPKDGYLVDAPGFTMLPEGKIEKETTGIGATTAEITSPRDSIIVFPSRSIAFNKALKHKVDKVLYVGSIPGSKLLSTKEGEILKYHQAEDPKYKKILVVADSLPKVFNAIGDDDEVYSKYFIMLDEIDKFQNESTFRSKLEVCIDYYTDKRCKGCVISATLEPFSKYLLRQQKKYIISQQDKRKKPVGICFFNPKEKDGISKFLREFIERHPHDKIVIAHKSVKRSLSFIEMFSRSDKKSTAILCGEQSRELVGKYFGELENMRCLPKRINFITSAYFAGVDIDEPFHLIIISDHSTNFSLLTASEMVQIYGRCRKELLSTQVLLPDKIYRVKPIQRRFLVDLAEAVAKSANKFEKVLSPLDRQLDAKAYENFRELILKLTHNGIQLVRRHKEGKVVVSSFTIDNYVNRTNHLMKMYRSKEDLLKTLGEYFDFNQNDVDNLSHHKELTIAMRDDAIKALKETYPEYPENLNTVEREIVHRIKAVEGIIREPKELFIFLHATKKLEGDAFRSAVLDVEIQALSEECVIPKRMREEFQVGEFYTNQEIRVKIKKILVESIGATFDVPKSIPGKKAKRYLDLIFTTQRTKQNSVDGYKVLGMKKPNYQLIPHKEPAHFPFPKKKSDTVKALPA